MTTYGVQRTSYSVFVVVVVTDVFKFKVNRKKPRINPTTDEAAIHPPTLITTTTTSTKLNKKEKMTDGQPDRQTAPI